MPTRVEKRGSQYCVVSKDTGETYKCYDDKDDAEAYNSALNIAYAKKVGKLPLEEDIKDDLKLIDDSMIPWDHS